MGSAGGKAHMNAYHKEIIGWLSLSNILVTNAPGVYQIEPIEIPGPGLKALKIPIAGGVHYYVEYRRAIGYDWHAWAWGDFFLNTDVYAGALLHMDNYVALGVCDTHLLDARPNSNPVPPPFPQTDQFWDSIDVVLREGETFQDSANNVEITTLAVTDDYLEVRLGPSPTGSCCELTGGCTVTTVEACTTGTWTEGETCEPNPCPVLIPAVSEWGVVVMVLFILVAGTIVFRRRGIGLAFLQFPPNHAHPPSE